MEHNTGRTITKLDMKKLLTVYCALTPLPSRLPRATTKININWFVDNVAGQMRRGNRQRYIRQLIYYYLSVFI